jgi:hypothetical protein
MRHSTTIFSLVLALATAASICASPAPADAEAIIMLGGKDQAVSDDSYDFLSDNQFLSAGHLSVAVGVFDRIFVGLEYVWAEEDFEPFDAVHNVLQLDGLTLISRFELPVSDFFRPYVSVGLGVYYADLMATVSSAEREQQLWLPAASGLVGVELVVPPRFVRTFLGISKSSVFSELTFGFNLEAGYEWVLTADFDNLQRPEPDVEPAPEDRPIEPLGIQYGDVDLSGAMMRSAFVTRF